MSNRLLPYDTIIKAHEGDPIAIQAVLDRYAGYIRYFSKMNGYYNSDMEDYIKTKLIESLFKFRLDRCCLLYTSINPFLLAIIVYAICTKKTILCTNI